MVQMMIVFYRDCNNNRKNNHSEFILIILKLFVYGIIYI